MSTPQSVASATLGASAPRGSSVEILQTMPPGLIIGVSSFGPTVVYRATPASTWSILDAAPQSMKTCADERSLALGYAGIVVSNRDAQPQESLITMLSVLRLTSHACVRRVVEVPVGSCVVSVQLFTDYLAVVLSADTGTQRLLLFRIGDDGGLYPPTPAGTLSCQRQRLPDIPVDAVGITLGPNIDGGIGSIAVLCPGGRALQICSSSQGSFTTLFRC